MTVWDFNYMKLFVLSSLAETTALHQILSFEIWRFGLLFSIVLKSNKVGITSFVRGLC